MSSDDTLNPYAPFYYGPDMPSTFLKTWRSRKYVGSAAPWGRVSVRRGYMQHSYHDTWPGPNAPLTVRDADPPPFGRLVGYSDFPQWYPDWTPTTDWVTLPGVAQIQLQQSVNYAGGDGGDGSGGAGGSNGVAVATITCENQAWASVAGRLGAYHVNQRGWLWPWRGYVPTDAPGGAVQNQNQWYDSLANAQILVEQGYGEDCSLKTFTGLLDTLGPGTFRPDRITLVARDFGGALVDVNPFSWNKDPRSNDPFYFVPPDYPNLQKLADRGTHNWVIVNDATDIVRCALRWCGFKEWEIEDAGVQLKTAYPVDRSSSWMDVVNTVASDLGYVFFIAEPTSDDLSIGVPIFRKQSVLRTTSPQPIYINSTMLTDVEPTHDNSNDRFIIRVRGRFATRKQGGRPIIGGDQSTDGQVLYTFQYWPPWMPKMAGIIKQLTYYNIGSNGVLGFSSVQQCMVACLLIAVQIALGRDTATIECPAAPNFGLDNMAYVDDGEASGIVSRLYITGRTSTMTIGGDGSSTSSSGNTAGSDDTEMLWSTQLMGSLVDNPEWEHIVSDYNVAITGGTVVSSGGHGQWS